MTTYYKTEAQAAAHLIAGQRVSLKPGSGYYCTWTPVKRLKPASHAGQYPLPPGAQVVSTTKALVAAFAGNAPIILDPGVYGDDVTSEIVNYQGLPIYSAVPQGARLDCGLVMGGNNPRAGGHLQGVVLNATETSRLANDGGAGALVATWGDGVGVTVMDCVGLCNGIAQSMVDCRNNQGLQLARLTATQWLGDGYRLEDDDGGSGSGSVIALLEDLYADSTVSVYDNGEQGAGCWIGCPVTVGRRLELARAATASLWVGGDFKDSILSDLVLYGAPVLIYLEHFSIDSIIERADLSVCTGDQMIDNEWDDGVAGNGASQGMTFRGVDLDARSRPVPIGINLQPGTQRPTVNYCDFAGFTECGILEWNVESPGDLTTGNTYELPSGAVPIEVRTTLDYSGLRRGRQAAHAARRARRAA